MGAGYFKNVISMATRTSAKIVGSYSVGPNSLDAADFEQEVLRGFSDLRTSNPKMLSDCDTPVYFYIQSTLMKVFSCSFTVRFPKNSPSQTFLKVFASLNNMPF